MTSNINICLAGDSNIISGLELVICSTMEFNKNINWHILTGALKNNQKHFNTITLEQQQTLKKIVKYYDPFSSITFINTESLYNKYLANSPNKNTPFTPYASLRLLMDLIFPHLDKILYLDADVIIQDNLSTMYNTYPHENFCYSAFLNNSQKDPYGQIVSGVIMFNLKKCKEKNFFNLARDNYNSQQFYYPDQFALELTTKPDPLPEIYDYVHNFRLCFPLKPTIIHFCFENDKKIYLGKESDFYKYYPEFIHYYKKINMIKKLH